METAVSTPHRVLETPANAFNPDRMQKLAEAITHNRAHSDNKETATGLKRLLPLTLTAGLLSFIR